eukprot:TRINITY_DN101649_c0_g1_i1.p1 TRINITY_DN101649_c0_g1~~TRINITY_DN101649_c0_g1_i1.p1  ORF type:complete len:486 (+),score=73.89 TRINITY_DN101649_c0_g1_i1:169-1626(+)
MKALICVQAFPPLLKQAGGVAKDYFALCRALIDGLGWTVTLMSPVDITKSGEPEIDRWLASGNLRHISAAAVECKNSEGAATILDTPAPHNMRQLFREASNGHYDVFFVDDALVRMALIMLMRGYGIPSIATTHSHVPSHPLYERLDVKLNWYAHMASCHVATVHASVTKVYAEMLMQLYRAPTNAIWPPVLWSDVFRRDPSEFADRAARERARWLTFFDFTPKAILLFAGRWSVEKRIHLLFDAVPEDCALVIVGDSDADYATFVEDNRRRNILPLRGMLQAEDLRTAYAASDLFVSASTCETLGNVVIEAWSAGTPVAIQPVGGHLEFVKDNENSYFVDFDDSKAARQRLSDIINAGAAQSVQPALGEMGHKLRNMSFAEEVRESLIQPALDISATWKARTGLFWVWEVFVRVLCVLGWLFCCFGAFLFSRTVITFSRDPAFTYLEPGSATESSGGKATVDLASQSTHASDQLLSGHSTPAEP